MDAFAAARLAVGAAFLAVAAASDLRTRHVRDPLWIGLGTLGLGLLGVQLALGSADLARYALLAAAALWFYAIFFGRPLFEEDGFHARPVRLVVLGLGFVLVAASAWRALVLGGSEANAYGQLVSVPLLVLIYQGFYQVGLVHGGADAKGLIALTLLVPTYPDAAPFPWIAVDPRVAGSIRPFFPFSFVAFVNAAILFLAVPLAYLSVNAARGHLELPQALFGTKVALDRRSDHVWLMEKMNARGEHVLVLFPRRGVDQEAEAAKLRAAGRTEAWVAHQVPFMVPLLAGFLLAFLAGNLLLGFLTAVLPRP